MEIKIGVPSALEKFLKQKRYPLEQLSTTNSALFVTSALGASTPTRSLLDQTKRFSAITAIVKLLVPVSGKYFHLMSVLS